VSPVALFLAASLPSHGSAETEISYNFLLVLHTSFIAYAGILGNYKLYALLSRLVPTKRLAVQTVLAWLAGNLFLGAQISYILRPFFGSPEIDIQFLRDNPMEGNFFEAFFSSLSRLTFRSDSPQL